MFPHVAGKPSSSFFQRLGWRNSRYVNGWPEPKQNPADNRNQYGER
jgi:hypothetical protein